jgi:hypothetical protein
LGDPDCQKVLVLVGDSTQPLLLESYHDYWIGGRPNFHVLPIFRRSASTSIHSLLPAEFQHLNANFWALPSKK